MFLLGAEQDAQGSSTLWQRLLWVLASYSALFPPGYVGVDPGRGQWGRWLDGRAPETGEERKSA